MSQHIAQPDLDSPDPDARETIADGPDSIDSDPMDPDTGGSDSDGSGGSGGAAAGSTADQPAESGGAQSGDGSGGESGGAESGEALLVREGDIAADYLERLLDILDYDGDIDLDVEGDRAAVAVVGSNLKGLIGTGGATLDSLQELTRLAVAQQTGVRTRLMLDVGGYRAQRRKELTDLGHRTAEAVKGSGTKEKLAPMNPFERKVVHDAVASVAGVFSESEGEEPSRCVVVLPQQ
ncbi:MAG: hypothetical protein M3500_05360 [Actinomycetota bacterium]|nr:hypothetical protein [Actinomycetota bacterium]